MKKCISKLFITAALILMLTMVFAACNTGSSTLTSGQPSTNSNENKDSEDVLVADEKTKTDEAYELYANKDLDGAIKLFEEAINEGESTLLTFIGIIDCYIEKGEIELATSFIVKGYTAVPDNEIIIRADDLFLSQSESLATADMVALYNQIYNEQIVSSDPSVYIKVTNAYLSENNLANAYTVIQKGNEVAQAAEIEELYKEVVRRQSLTAYYDLLSTTPSVEYFSIEDFNADSLPELITSENKGMAARVDYNIYTFENGEMKLLNSGQCGTEVLIAPTMPRMVLINDKWITGEYNTWRNSNGTAMENFFTSYESGNLETIFFYSGWSTEAPAEYVYNGTNITEDEYNALLENQNIVLGKPYYGEVIYIYENSRIIEFHANSNSVRYEQLQYWRIEQLQSEIEKDGIVFTEFFKFKDYDYGQVVDEIGNLDPLYSEGGSYNFESSSAFGVPTFAFSYFIIEEEDENAKRDYEVMGMKYLVKDFFDVEFPIFADDLFNQLGVEYSMYENIMESAVVFNFDNIPLTYETIPKYIISFTYQHDGQSYEIYLNTTSVEGALTGNEELSFNFGE